MMQDTSFDGIMQENPEKKLTFLEFATSAKLESAKLERQPDGNFKTKSLTADIFEALPERLKIGVDTLTDATDKDVFLMGSLGALSAVMPNISGVYDGKPFTPNLFVYIIGNAGIGKGALSYALQLVMPIHAYKSAEVNEEGETKRRLLIPANNSSSGAIELLSENEGEGLIFETEGDTLANVFKSDFGNYSDSFRKAFGHERIALYRKTNKEDVDILKPKLSTVISSTFGQMLSLIPDAENGLFSRFLFYELVGNDDFKDVFATNKRNYSDVFSRLGNDFLRMYETLVCTNIDFELAEDQKRFFMETFRTWKKEIIDHLEGNDLDGTTHRLGLIMFRISMTLTVIRNIDKLTSQTRFVCSDTDFFNAFKIIEIAKNNAIALFKRLPKPKYFKSEKENQYLQKAEQFEKVKSLHEKGESLSAIADYVFGDKKKKAVVQLWINKIKKGEKMV
ncbi:MAG: hypothetical protein RLZZ628_4405 [Bacteroidota bacterium]|jgi:hypothetical protein